MLTNGLEKAERECNPKKKSRQAGNHNPVWMKEETRKKRWARKKYLRTKDWRDQNTQQLGIKQGGRPLDRQFWKYAQSKKKTRPNVLDHITEENAGLTTTHNEKAELLDKLYSIILRG